MSEERKAPEYTFERLVSDMRECDPIGFCVTASVRAGSACFACTTMEGAGFGVTPREAYESWAADMERRSQ